MSLWRKISLSILTVSVLLVSALIFLVGTSIGLHLIFNIVNRWVPELEVGLVSGNLSDLHLENVYYEGPGIIVNTGEFHLAVKIEYLHKNSLCIKHLSLKDVNIVIDSKKILESNSKSKYINKDKYSNPLLDFFMSYPVRFEDLILNNVNLKIDDTVISVTNLLSGLIYKDKNVTLMPTILKGLLIILPRAVDTRYEGMVKQKIHNHRLEKDQFDTMLKDFFLKPILPKSIDVYLPINFYINEFIGEDLHLTSGIDLIIYNLFFKASCINSTVQLDTLDIKSNYGEFNATGIGQLYNNWPVDMILSGMLNIDKFKGEKVKLRVIGALRGRLDLLGDFCGLLDMTLQVQMQLAEAGLPLNLKMFGRRFCWPFVREKDFKAEKIILKLDGKITDYKLSLCMMLKGQKMPTAAINLYANGNEYQINFNSVNITVLNSKIQLTALLDWRQTINWIAELKLDGIDIAKEVPNWNYPLKLSGLVKTYGSHKYDGSWYVAIPELKITGHFKENKVNIDGSLEANTRHLQWFIPNLSLSVGQNVANLKGELSFKEFHLDLDIDAPRLDNVLLGLQGVVKGYLKVRGSRDSPQLLANFTASDLCWQEHTVACIKLISNIKYINQVCGQLNICTEHDENSRVNIKLGKLEIKGNERHHVLQLHVQGEPISGQLLMSGNFNRQTGNWEGRINNAYIVTPVGKLIAAQSINLNYYSVWKKVSIGPHIWNGPNIELRVLQTINLGAKGRVAVELACSNLTILKPFIPDTTQINGVLSVKAYIVWDSLKEKLPQISVTSCSSNMEVTQEINGVLIVVDFDNLNFNAQIDNNHVDLTWFIRLTNNGQFDGRLQIENTQGYPNLNGFINIKNFNLAIINNIFPYIEKASYIGRVAGIFNAHLRLTGNTERPQLFGCIKLRNIDVNSHLVLFKMHPSQFTMNFYGHSSTFLGIVRTQQGEINLSGDIHWSKLSNWCARLITKGKRVHITIPPMMDFDISPDIVFTVTPQLRMVTGEIWIPWARIVVRELPESTIAVSNDEVIFKRNLSSIKTRSTRIPIDSNLIVHIGNDISIDAFGLKAKLTGDLKVVEGKQDLGFNGQINMLEGRFRAYGQDLIVRKGELLFAGPLDQPVLNIEAIRNPELTENDVISGIRITALADEPKIEIFSDPVMSQQEALSYLLRGHGFISNQSDSTVITSMLVSLGVTQSNKVITKVGEMFGISNLMLDTQGVGDSSRVVVSGYLLPDLQVKYGVGIFDALATLTVRYRIMPSLYLEAISGVNQVLDLLYQFDF